MCGRTESSDPAHPHFWHKCLQNEEQIENPPKIKYSSKKVYQQKDRLQRR